jgi:hypothetical protein
MSKLELDNVIFIGRTFHEYMAMFGLREEELFGKRILDCPWRSVLVYGNSQ